MRQYYLRKVEQGKNKMSVINAVRAKIVARMFAVINKNEKWLKDRLFDEKIYNVKDVFLFTSDGEEDNFIQRKDK